MNAEVSGRGNIVLILF